MVTACIYRLCICGFIFWSRERAHMRETGNYFYSPRVTATRISFGCMLVIIDVLSIYKLISFFFASRADDRVLEKEKLNILLKIACIDRSYMLYTQYNNCENKNQLHHVAHLSSRLRKSSNFRRLPRCSQKYQFRLDDPLIHRYITAPTRCDAKCHPL